MGEWESLHRLSDLIGSAGRDLGMPDAVATGRLWARWNQVVGREVAAHVQPTSLRGGVLRVRTESLAWATEITYLGAEIARRANQMLGAELVEEVRVWTGPGRLGKPTNESGPTPQGASGREEESLDPEEALRRAREAWERRRRARPRPPESA
jgi:hypothetical protein